MKRYCSRSRMCLVVLGLLGLFAVAASATDDALTKTLVEYYRRKASVPPGAQVTVRDVRPSKLTGAKSGILEVNGRQVAFTVSDDGRYAFFGELEDLTLDPFSSVMKKISLNGRATKGPRDAKVTIVEYSDFQCPFCGRAYQTIENQVLPNYHDKVRFVYKHFPLTFHAWAEPAAVASECAQQQQPEAFWMLYSLYFRNQRDFNPQNVRDKSIEVLKDSGVDIGRFRDCFDAKKTLAQVRADQAEGSALGVRGTPAFFINGRLVRGAQPYRSFTVIIDDELARAGRH